MLFELVFDQVETELASAVAKASQQFTDPRSALLAGCNAYIRIASSDAVARIVLIDAPALLGPERYRSIDERHFLPMIETAIEALHPQQSKRSLRPLSRAMFAAVCELSLEAFLHPSSKSDIKQAVLILAGNLAGPSPTRCDEIGQ